MIAITDADVRRYVTFDAVFEAVERAFVALDEGRSELLETVRGRGGSSGHTFGVKAGRDGSIPLIGVKAGSYAPDNREAGLPAHASAILLLDDETGHAVAAVEANYLNGLRTSAADALAVRALARQDASTLSIVGIGGQAVFEVLAVASVRPIRRVLAVGTDAARRTAFMAALREKCDVPVEFVDAEVAARSADILVTATPSRTPLIRAEWVRPGTHISAMGADAVGKQELDAALVTAESVWVDHPEQAVRIGEAQHAYAKGAFSLEDLRRRTLGGLLRGTAVSRRYETEVTIFDSSGVAIQDIAAAHAALGCVQRHRAGA